jgi:nitroreductase
MKSALDAIRHRHSARAPFDPQRRITSDELASLLEAARWAPTAHNMQNFEIVAIDDPDLLAAVGAIETRVTEAFLAENRTHVVASIEELRARGYGLLATTFPPAWLDPATRAADLPPGKLANLFRGAPLVLLVLFDAHDRAPGSDRDGLVSIGCVLENLWLAAEALGLAAQMISSVANEATAAAIRRVLGIPDRLSIAYALRVGMPLAPTPTPRVRREISAFVHHNRYGMR